MEDKNKKVKRFGMDCPTVWQLILGILCAVASGLVWWLGGLDYVSRFFVGVVNFYLIAVLIEAARRAGQVREIEKRTDQSGQHIFIVKPKQPICFEFPHRGWSILLVFLLLFTVVVGFANMYIKNRGIVSESSGSTVTNVINPLCRCQGGDVVSVETLQDVQEETTSQSSLSRIDAAYYSMAITTFIGSGDFKTTTEPARVLVTWQLVTGLELLVGAFALLIARIADF